MSLHIVGMKEQFVTISYSRTVVLELLQKVLLPAVVYIWDFPERLLC